MGNTDDHLRRLLKPQQIHSLETPKLSICCAICCILLLEFHDVGLDVFRRDTLRPHFLEEGLQVTHVLINASRRLPFIDLVILFDECREILKADRLNLRSSIESCRHRPFFFFQQSLRFNSIQRPRALLNRSALLVA